MDETAFQAELNKYKIIRQPNYYKSRNRPKVAKSTASSNSGISTNVIAKEVVSSNIINSNESNFWELFSAANSSILTTAESIKFIEALKKVRKIVQLFCCYYQSLIIFNLFLY